ncbi:MAG: helix-turn-helix transcriptional regulator, partial [Gordonia sp. (in: high G+C Gram-positive bacteria)]
DAATAAARCARRSCQGAVEAQLLHAAVRFGGHDADVVDRLAELVEQVDGPVCAAYARHAAAAAAGDGPALDASSTEFEKLGLLVSAADAAGAAATEHEKSGARTAMAASGTRAAALAVQCGGLRTPAVIAAAHPLPLTSREREIASLVAVGLSNREIADRLVVSVRTVEGHIYRACMKFDLTDRSELGNLVAGDK